MENKNSMSRVERLHREKVTRYSIRKYSFGAASVAVAALFMFLGNGAVSADMTAVQPQDESGLKAERPDENAELPQVEKEVAQPAESTPAAQPIAEEPTAKPAEPVTPALDKKQLESYIKEIEAKLANGSYANKTDESVAVLKADLEAAKTTLVNATSQGELTKAYNKLVTTANTKLKNKPVEKKETPAVDTTNGKETVGKQAENTEKKSDSNSIENTGSNDPRNGKAMDKENALRTETTKSVGNISYTLEFSDDAKKEIYLYNEEDANVNITVNSTDGAIRNAFIKAAGNVYLDPDKKAKKLPSGNETKEEVDGFGWTYHQILSDTPSPATVSVTGKPNDTFKRLAAYTKKEDQHAVLGDRYLQVQDAAGGSITAGGNSGSAGYFKLVVKSQTYKYNIQEPAENGNKIGVTDIDNLTATDIQKIKDQIKIEYSKTSTDARLESKKGQLVDNQNSIVKRIDVDTTSKKVVVTYTDDSTDETPLSNIARTNEKPTVEIEYSDSAADKKEVYVYASEVNTFDIKIKDDSGKIASAELKRGSNQDFKDVAGETNKQDTQYGFTANKFTSETTATAENPAVITYTGTPAPEGTFTETKLKEVTRGENPPGIALGWRFVKAIDKDGADARGNGRDATDPTAVNVVLKPQTLKYDIKEVAQADKLPVADASNVTEAEFNEIKKRVEIQYSKTNPDKRLESKRGEVLTNRDERVDTIERNGNNLVVTYKDGSTDTKPLTDFARTNVAPTVSIPYSDPAPNKKEVYLYTGEEADVDITFNDDSGKIKSAALKKGGNIALNNVGGNPDLQDNEWGFTVTAINSETATPAKIKVTGQVSGIAQDRLPKTENDSLELVTRFATATDTDGAEIANNAVKNKNNGEVVGTYLTDPGAVTFVLKAQAKKYDIVTPTEADKVAVADPTAVTDEEFAKIKAKLEYSRTNEDKNLESKRGEAVDNTDNKVATITKEGNNIVATYKDGSKDVRPLTDFTKLDKQPAIDAVNTAATEKIAAINATPNATDEEKAAAIAKVNADKTAALTAINDATTKTTLDTAKESGTTAISADNPVVAKKDAAKADVETARKAKEDAIKANPNLTQAEKDAAIAKNNAAAAEATKAIDTATTNDAVDQAKTAGTTAIGKVNPVAKENAKEAIANALTAKNSEIDKRTDLTDAEKTAAKAEAQKLADAELAKINAQPDNADTPEAAAAAQKLVAGAEDKGVADVTSVNPVAKEAAKKAVADELTKKEEQIDARTDLTTEEKAAAKEEAKAKAKEATDAIDAQPDNADTPEKAAEAQKAVDTAKKTGVDEVAAVNPEAVTKPAAKKAIDDKLAEQLKAIENTPDATDDEKKVAADAAKALAEEAKKEIDKAGTDAEVKKLQEEAEKEIEKSVPVVEDKPNARKAIDDEATAKKAAIDARDDLTPKAKEDLKAQVDKIAEQAKKSVDAAKTAEAVNGIEESDKAAIKAVGEVNIPADKVLVNDPSALTDAEKAKVLEAVKKVNPDAKEITQDADGNVTVTTPDGHQEIITPEQVVKTADTANDPKAGNDVVKPADKVVVNDPAKLTDAEKEKIKAAVEAVNPNSIVVVDDKGNAKVSTPDGQTQVIPVEDLVRTVEDTKKPNAGNDIVKPADKTVVANPDKLTDAEKKAIEDKVKAVNPGSTVVVDDKGNATVTTPEGKTAVIPATDLVKSPEAATKPNAGNDIVKPADKTAVTNPEKLTDAEKKAIEDKVKAVNPGATVVVDDKGNATVTTPEGKTAVIPATDLVKSPEDAIKPNAGNDIVKPADKTVVANPEKLTDAEKKAIEDKVKAVNPDATVVVDDKGNATVTTPAGKTAVIPATDLTKSEADAAKPNAGDDIVKPADKTVVANPEKLTDAEKKAIEDKVKAVNPGSTVVVDDKGNATVTTPEGKTAVIPATDLTKSEVDAAKPNAGDDIVKPADKTVVANPDKLTDAEKKAIEDKVKAVNPGSTVVVDDKGNATVTTPAGKTAVIPATDLTKSGEDAAKPNAGNDVNTPAAKTVVANPDKLTDAEKKAIEDKVKAVNPGATVVVDDKGNATVTTPEGKTAVIPATDLVKTQDDITKENAGNDVNTPAAKTVVANPDALTSEEKKAIEDKVKAVNPGSTVVVDDKGNATVAKGDGTVLNIPALDLVIPADDLADAAKNTAVKTPAIRTLVADKEKLTDAEKAAVKKAIEAVNPGATVVVDDKGNATVTLDGNTVSIAKDQLVKTASDVTVKNSGDNINLDFEKETVADLNNLTDAEKEAAKVKIKGANADVVEVIFDKAGNATVVTKDGKVLAIAAEDIFKQRPSAPNNGGNGTSGNNAANNTDAKVNKAKLEGAIHQLDELIIKESAKLDAETAKEANALSADAKKVFANADASQAEVDAMVKRIEDFMAKVASSTDHATPANDQAAQKPAVAPATTQAAANASQEAATNARKAAKELPNTGTADSTVAMVAAAASALLGLGLAGRRRKEDEEA